MKSNKVILITGAGGGLGTELAIACLGTYSHIVLLDVDKKKLLATQEKLLAKNKTVDVTAVQMDFLLAKDSHYQSLADQIKQNVPNIQSVAHCASLFQSLSPLAQQSTDEWADQYRVNTVAPFALTKCLLPILENPSSVLLIGDNHYNQPRPFFGAFGASYAGLAYFMQVASQEWLRYGIKINLAIPHNIHSPERIRTHPGEAQSERKSIASILPTMLSLLDPLTCLDNGNTVLL